MEKYSGLIALAIFLVLLVIFLRNEAERLNELEQPQANEELSDTKVVENTPLDLNDQDALVACLVCSIDAREKSKKNIKIINVRRIA